MILDLKDFQTVPVRASYSPVFIKYVNAVEVCSTDGRDYSAGYLTNNIVLEDNQKSCHVSIPFRKNGRAKAAVIVTFLNGEQKPLQSDYLHNNGNAFELDCRIPGGAKEAVLRLMFRCQGSGSVIFENPLWEVNAYTTSRVMKIASAYIECKNTYEDNLRSVLELIDEAGAAEEKPNIICFTECVYDLRCKERSYIHENSEEINQVRKKAKENNIYVIFTSHERDDMDYWYNTAYLISNKGEICGKYRKTHLTWGEYMAGMLPGEDLPVFDTPWGKIGIMICWDQWFPEAARRLTQKGAEVIFWLTKGFHEARVVTRARDNGAYYVVCNPNPQNCGVVHPTTGKWVVRGEQKPQGFAFAQIDLAERPASEYKSFGTFGGNDREIFLNEVRQELYVPEEENWNTVKL